MLKIFNNQKRNIEVFPFQFHTCNSHVSLLSRYGICPPSFFFLSSPRALITFPSDNRPLFICTPGQMRMNWIVIISVCLQDELNSSVSNAWDAFALPCAPVNIWHFHAPSLNRKPSVPVLLALSEPARSTKCSFAYKNSSASFAEGNMSCIEERSHFLLFSRVIVKIAWERLSRQNNYAFYDRKYSKAC